MMDLAPFLAALSIIGLAELGDKTQLLTVGFALKYPAWEIIAAVFCASGVLMAAAVFLGGLLNQYLPLAYVQLFAGLAFIFFGLWAIFGKKEEEKAKFSNSNPFRIVFASFLLAELGDKTQLAALALSAKYGSPLQVWLGATLAMVGMNGMGILVGKWSRKFIAESHLNLIGAGVFILFGLLTLGELYLW